MEPNYSLYYIPYRNRVCLLGRDIPVGIVLHSFFYKRVYVTQGDFKPVMLQRMTWTSDPSVYTHKCRDDGLSNNCMKSM